MPRADFLAWYREYPRREARKDAWNAWNQLTDEQTQEAVKALPVAQKIYAGRQQIHIPLPATYLRAERWTDELPRQHASKSFPI